MACASTLSRAEVDDERKRLIVQCWPLGTLSALCGALRCDVGDLVLCKRWLQAACGKKSFGKLRARSRAALGPTCTVRPLVIVCAELNTHVRTLQMFCGIRQHTHTRSLLCDCAGPVLKRVAPVATVQPALPMLLTVHVTLPEHECRATSPDG